jgi:hypothetical protein
MADATQVSEVYESALRRIHLDENGKHTSTYFGWGIEIALDESTKEVVLTNNRHPSKIASIATDGTITLYPIPSQEELEAMLINPELTVSGQHKVSYNYFTYISFSAFEQLVNNLRLFEKIRLKKERNGSTYIWTTADESTPIKERKCPTCKGLRKTSGMCHSSTVKGCTDHKCEEAAIMQAKVLKNNPRLRVVPPSMYAHDHIHICKHGLTSTHETKLSEDCYSCTGSGKKVAGGNPRYRKWFGNNTIVINPDFSYAVEPSEEKPEYHEVHWEGMYS